MTYFGNDLKYVLSCVIWFCHYCCQRSRARPRGAASSERLPAWQSKFTKASDNFPITTCAMGLSSCMRCRNWISYQLKPIGGKSTAWGLLNDQFSSKELPRQRITDLSGAVLGARRIKPVHDRNDRPNCPLRKQKLIGGVLHNGMQICDGRDFQHKS